MTKYKFFQNTCLLVFFPIRLFNSSYAKSCVRSDACQGYWYHDHSHYIISMIMIWRRMPIYPFLIIHLTRGKNKLKLATFAKYKPGKFNFPQKFALFKGKTYSFISK